MIYVGSGSNQIASGAALALTNQNASSVYRERPLARKGTGKLSLSGAYTGAADALLEVEIVSATPSGTPVPSAPKFTGVGSGSLIEAAFESGAPAETITVTLIDKGTQTTRAFAPLEGVLIRAKAFGTSGNAITISIDRSAITYTATQRSLTSELPARATAQLGERWNFGAVNLTPEGEIPAAAPRIAFARAGAVYRHYREFIGREYAYSITPANERAIPQGARVFTVTGSYTVVITDGTTTRTYSSIVTLYDLLSAIRADGSSLVDVVGAVVADRRPGGMGAIDLQTYTAPYIVSIDREGSKYIERCEPEITLASTTPQEILTLECVNADELHGEVFRCSATVSGQFDDVVTEEPATRGPYTITIPRAIVPAINPQEGVVASLEAAGTVKPILCVDRPQKGPRARQREYKFKWTTAKDSSGDPAECECTPIFGGPFGTPLGGDQMASAQPMAIALAAQLEPLYEWGETFHQSQTIIQTSGTDTGPVPTDEESNGDTIFKHRLTRIVSATIKADKLDIKACTLLVQRFARTLEAVYTINGGSFSPAPAAAALTLWNTQRELMQTAMEDLDSLEGGWLWRANSAIVSSTGGTPTLLPTFNKQLLIDEVGLFIDRFNHSLNLVCLTGGVRPLFEEADDGSGVGVSPQSGPRFVSQNGLTDLFLNQRYVSARLQPDDFGAIRPVDTQEFSIGISVGCPELLQDGDTLTISIDGGMTAYQVGDTIKVSTIYAAPIGLGGGQVGSDEITWSVAGSTTGPLANYAVRRVTYATDRGAVANQTAMLALSSAVVGDYCQRTDLGGAVFALIVAGPSTLANWRQMTYTSAVVRFRITPAGRDFALGDVFTFAGEGGTFRHRLNGGSWSSALNIADQSIGSGLTVVTTPQQAPSWAAADVYAFDLIAESGADNLRSLSSSRARWTGASTLTITPSSPPRVIALGAISYADGTALAITGSNDNFSTSTAVGSAIVARGHAALVLDTATTFAKLRVALPSTGAAAWAYVGAGVQMASAEAGILERGEASLTSGTLSRSLGATIAHSGCSSTAVTSMRSALDTAHATDNGYIGAIVEVSPYEMAIGGAPESFEVSDLLNYQSPSAARLLSFSISINGAAL